jgi:15-hydroxyprostaglandin dehydrogenase (NAD)
LKPCNSARRLLATLATKHHLDTWTHTIALSIAAKQASKTSNFEGTQQATKLVAGVTGGARGIGKAYAEALVKRGYCVAIFDIDGAIELGGVINTPTVVTGFNCDCSDGVSFRSSFEAGLKYFQVTSYAVFVCNAGIVRPLFSEAERQVQVNLMGAIHGVEMAIKAATGGFQHPASSPHGLNVIVTSSTNGIVPADSDLAPIYVATKFALVGLVRS